MPMYVTRVELHGANSEDYNNLHQFMISEGFSMTIRDQNDITYHLPTAEYFMATAIDYTADQVRQKASVAAAKTSRMSGIITTRAHQPSDISFIGLIPV